VDQKQQTGSLPGGSFGVIRKWGEPPERQWVRQLMEAYVVKYQ